MCGLFTGLMADAVAKTDFGKAFDEVDEGVFGENNITIDHENVVGFAIEGFFGDFVASFCAIVAANEGELGFEIATI